MPNRLISFHYTVKDATGNLLESSYAGRPISYLEGQHRLISSVDKAVRKLRPGERTEVFIPAADAYGLYDEELLLSLPRPSR